MAGNPEFYPLTIKAAYVIGIIHDICDSVSCLLRVGNTQATYIPAYGVFASGVELLGRCIRGNRCATGNVEDLSTGFQWLAPVSSGKATDDTVLIRTSIGEYTIGMLIAMRHFSAHGQATSRRKLGNLDFEILAPMPNLIADGLERYWWELQQSEEFCDQLARANILAFRQWPVFRIWSLFERDATGKYHSITDIFTRFHWRVVRQPTLWPNC